MTHPCLSCESRTIPTYRAFCAGCFDGIPWKLRADVMAAYRCRFRNRIAFEEKRIELKQYLRERGEKA